jgi:hypothetical protein
MFRNSLIAAVASTAIAVAAPAIAQGHGGGGGTGGPPGAGGSPAGSVSQGPMNASPTGISHANENSVLSSPPTGSTMQTTTAPMTTPTTTTTGTVNGNSQATVKSQGPANASPTGIAHASPNSVLARGAVASSTLPGLTTGLVVNNSSGTQVGTVSRVITGPNSTIRAVVVTSSSGKTYTLMPSTLSISGNVVTTTSTSIGG